MTPFLATAGGYVCCLMLGIAGVAHVRHLRAFESLLRRQRILPVGSVALWTRVVVAVELALGCAGLVVLAALDSDAGKALVLLAVALLYAAYAGYAGVLLARGSDVPCGCSGADHPVDRTVVMRAAGLGLIALDAAIGAGSILAPSGEAEFLIAATASIGLTAILWALPAALWDPGPAQAASRAPILPSVRGAR